MRARFYNPVIGRFTQEDTYCVDGLNLYAYCGNNPVACYDPSGYLCSTKINQYNDEVSKFEDNRLEYLRNKFSKGENEAQYNLPVPYSDTVDIIFDVNEDSAKKYGYDKMKKVAAHLAEQNSELNRLSTQHTDDLIMNLSNFHNMPIMVREKIVDKYRALANKYWFGGKTGDKLDGAHALNSVAGGYLSKFIGLRDNFANQ